MELVEFYRITECGISIGTNQYIFLYTRSSQRLWKIMRSFSEQLGQTKYAGKPKNQPCVGENETTKCY